LEQIAARLPPRAAADDHLVVHLLYLAGGALLPAKELGCGSDWQAAGVWSSWTIGCWTGWAARPSRWSGSRVSG
jgi:hypothetical protein